MPGTSISLLEVKGWTGAKPISLAPPGLTEPPHAWAIIPPDVFISRHVEVLLASEATIIAVDALEAADQHLARGPFLHVSPSPNGKRLALLTATNVLWVVSSDFQNSLVEFEVDKAAQETGAGSGAAVRYVQWCGDDAVFVGLDSVTLLVGPGPSLPCVGLILIVSCSIISDTSTHRQHSP